MSLSPAPSSREPIALVGIGCRLPGGADSPAAFLKVMTGGVNTITDIPPERWDWRRFYDPDPDKPNRTTMRRGGFLREPIDRFDAAFFGISPREAEQMDPQQRFLLEVAWEALEDAGTPWKTLKGTPTGVYIGGFTLDTKISHFNLHNRHLINAHSSTSATMTMLANRISYVLDFRGPSLTIDTACSSSLVAFHYACQDLWRGACPAALAGGVNIMFRPEYAITLSKGRFLSPDGRCKAFDASADGYVRGEGAGVVLLKPLSRALADQDRIYALVRGTGVNQDGHTPGITLPGKGAQTTLLREVCRDAGIAPQSIQYVEAHGTGTQAGDTTEAEALGEALGAGRTPDQTCIVGSVKTNIGHLEAAAGIAGVIKTALCLYHKTIPPNLHFNTPNPAIPFEDLRLRVPIEVESWPEAEGPALAGVNSFGYGGANAHAILEGCSDPEDMKKPRGPEISTASDHAPLLLPLSARSASALAETIAGYAELLDKGGVSLHTAAAVTALRRSHHPYRVGLVAATTKEAIEQLSGFKNGSGLIEPNPAPDSINRLVFVYTGMGPQWWAMGRELFHTEPVYRAVIEECDALFRLLANWSLIDALLADESAEKMHEPEVAQNTNLALQLGLTALWKTWGVEPEAVVGHSVGEIAAARAAGALSLEDAVKTSFHRGCILQQVKDQGRMLAVELPEERALEMIGGLESLISLAGVNGQKSVTLAGDGAALEEMADYLAENEIYAKFLHVNVAYHSYQMNPYKAEMLSSLADLSPHPPALPLYSTVTGGRIIDAAHDAAYWWTNLRQPVRFARAMNTMIGDGLDTYLEVGPHPVLAAYIKEALAERSAGGATLCSLRRKKAERRTMLEACAALYERGRMPDWPVLFPGEHPFVDLPRYPWQRETFFMESEAGRADRIGDGSHPLAGIRLETPGYERETPITEAMHGYLRDHRIQNAVIFPGAAYIEAMLAVDRELFGTRPTVVEQIDFHTAMAMPDEDSPLLKIRYDAARGIVGVYSAVEGRRKDWTLHAEGRLPAGAVGADGAVYEVEGIQNRCTDAVSSDDLYAHLHGIGYQYGPAFQRIRQVRLGDLEAFAEVHGEDIDDFDRYILHPSLLDAAFQTLIAAGGLAPDADLFMPVSIERMQRLRPPDRRMFACGRLTGVKKATIRGDVALVDASGRPYAVVTGLKCRLLKKTGGAKKERKWHYQERWTAAPEEITEMKTPPRTSFLFCDRGKIGDEIAEHLKAADFQAVSFYHGASFQNDENGVCHINPNRLEDFRRALHLATPPEDIRILYLWPLDHGSCDDVSAQGLASGTTLLYLTQTLVERGNGSLTVVTRNAQPDPDGMAPVDPSGAALWGLLRTIRLEHPEIQAHTIDIDTEETSIQTLEKLLLSELSEPELCIRRGAVQVRRLAQEGENESTFPVSTDSASVALEIGRPGLPDTLRYRLEHSRSPGAREVQVRVHTVGLNFKDIMKAMGLLSDRVLEDTFFGEEMGMECTGEVTATGNQVEDFRPGDRVIVVTGAGCFRSCLTVSVDEAYIVPIPAPLSEETGPVIVPFFTAYKTLHDLARLKKGERILIHSATGGVGLAAIQYARSVGAEICATAGSSEKRTYLQSLGIDQVYDSRSLAFADEILAHTDGYGVDVTLNTLTGEAMRKSLELTAPYGRFIEIGKLDIDENTGLGLRPFNRNLSYISFDGDRLLIERREDSWNLLHRVCRLFEEGVFSPIVVESFPAEHVTDAYRHMAQALHIGKVAVSMHRRTVPALPHKASGFAIRPDGNYLITGGLGGFGLATARWLATCGARHLTLIGRRTASDSARETIAAIEADGVQVEVMQVDISERGQVMHLIEKLKAGEKPLKGVFHAAGVLADALVEEQTPDLFEQTWRPKAAGAWHLHQATLDMPLDLFILYSSATAVSGNTGQTNYTSANAFMDGLAAYRRSLGLTALSINWGAIADVGMAARVPGIARRLEQLGIRAMKASEALEEMVRIGSRTTAHIMIGDMEWTQWLKAHDGRQVFSFLKAFTEAASNGHTPRNGSVTLDASLRLDDLENLIRNKAARILKSSPEKIDVHRSMMEQGMDSLMGAELVTGVQVDFSVEISQMDLIQHNSVEKLALLLNERIRSNGHSG